MVLIFSLYAKMPKNVKNDYKKLLFYDFEKPQPQCLKKMAKKRDFFQFSQDFFMTTALFFNVFSSFDFSVVVGSENKTLHIRYLAVCP
jgi:hypothetical protein